MRLKMTGAVAACLCLFGASSAVAAPITYQWTAAGYLLSADRDALETITGLGPDSAVWAPAVSLWATTGGAFGTFTYDSSASGDAAAIGTGAVRYANTITDWSSTLYGPGGTVLGSVSSDSGSTVVGNDNSGTSLSDDLINMQTCYRSCQIDGGNPTGYQGFTTGSWLSTFSSLLWLGGDFQDHQNLPAGVPPAGAATQIASFGFFDLSSQSRNAQIFASNLQIEAVTVPEPPVSFLLGAALAGLALLRRRRAGPITPARA